MSLLLIWGEQVPEGPLWQGGELVEQGSNDDRIDGEHEQAEDQNEEVEVQSHQGSCVLEDEGDAAYNGRDEDQSQTHLQVQRRRMTEGTTRMCRQTILMNEAQRLALFLFQPVSNNLPAWTVHGPPYACSSTKQDLVCTAFT